MAKNQIREDKEKDVDVLKMVRVATAVPMIKIGDAGHNADEIISLIYAADDKGADFILFPELTITGYTCADLFYRNSLYAEQNKAIERIVDSTNDRKIIVILGIYVKIFSRYISCGAIIQKGVLQGIVPKSYIPNTKEFYEARWFGSGLDLMGKGVSSIDIAGMSIPFGRVKFSTKTESDMEVQFGLEICEDLWVPIRPSAKLSLSGAHIIFNPSASPEMVAKSAYRAMLVTEASASNIGAYVYASAGVGESTTDLVFGGHSIIAEYGVILKEGKLFSRKSEIEFADIDIARIDYERVQNSAFFNASMYEDVWYDTIQLDNISGNCGSEILRYYSKNPFVPMDDLLKTKRCEEIFSIQSAGLAGRLERTNMKKLVVGVSGGLDSTLALLVAVETMKLLGLPNRNIIAVTMPGFGTTEHTLANAEVIMKELDTDYRNISIKAAVLQHFKDIGHNPDIHDTSYENAQARERTQILMDIANKEGALVVGTGDLSEIALGWSTYNGDHMSMYAVNASVPKTLIQYVIKYVLEKVTHNQYLVRALQSILDTPISPELLPPTVDGKIEQKTEEKIGPYVVHDFILYYYMRHGMDKAKLCKIAKKVFSKSDEFSRAYTEDEIEKFIDIFFSRFYTQQFKRSCMPDGPKVGSVALSPRGDYRQTSDISF